MRDSASADIAVKKASVEHHQLNKSRQSELSRFQDQMKFVQFIKKSFLGPIQFELGPLPLLVRDPV